MHLRKENKLSIEKVRDFNQMSDRLRGQQRENK